MPRAAMPQMGRFGLQRYFTCESRSARLILLCGTALLWLAGCVADPEEIAREEEKRRAAAAAAEAKEAAARAMAIPEPAVSEEFHLSGSGLKYRVLKSGTGRKPLADSIIQCHYRGWLDDGKEFDSTYGGEPSEFPLNALIPAWKEALPMIREGAKIELEVPGYLGYGAAGSPPAVPPNATLHFEIELLKVVDSN